MTLSIFGYLIADAESPPGSTGAPRLRDLIVGLLSGDIAAATILGRLDPNLSDEVRAMVAHRGMTAESFLANALMAFAFDVADESWRQAIKYREPIPKMLKRRHSPICSRKPCDRDSSVRSILAGRRKAPSLTCRSAAGSADIFGTTECIFPRALRESDLRCNL